MTYALGVDIGTSYTAAAVWRDGRASTVTLADRADSIPSAVFLREDGSLLIGDAAVRRGVLEPDRLARGFKRSLGDPTPLLLGQQTMARTELTGQLLRFVLAKVIAREGGPPSHVTLTVPATWGPHHRGLMTTVAAEAGLSDVGLLPEPVAIAIHYAAQERIDPGAVMAIYDLGGGTFDAALVQRVANGYELRGQPGGDETIGGEDFDDVLMNQVRRSLGNALTMLDLSDDAVLAGLQQVRVNAIAAKEALSADVDASITVILPGLTREVRVTRGDFEGAIRIPLLRTVEALERTIGSAGLAPADVNAVLLAGGSSQIPLVSQLIAAELGIRVITDAHPKYAVCLGAALAAASRAAPGIAPVVAQAPVQIQLDGDTAALLAAPTGPSEAAVTAVPAAIGLAEPADVVVRSAPGIRRTLRYLSDRDELVVQVHGDSRRGRRAVLLALALVALVVVGVVLAATGGWFRGGGDGGQVPASSPATGPITATSGAQSATAGPVTLIPVTLIPMTISTAAGEGARAVTMTAVGMVAVGGTADPAGPREWTLDGQNWAATPTPRLPPGQRGQLNGVTGAAGRPLVAVGWRGDPATAADPKQRHGDVWVSPDGRAWGEATVPDVGELTDVVRLPAGSLVAAGVSYAADPNDGDAVILTSADGASWTKAASTGLDGPGPFELRRLVADPAGGLVALGARLDGAVLRSGLWRSTDGTAWTFDSWLPATGSGVADVWGLTVAGDGNLLAVGNQSGAEAGPVVWRFEAGRFVVHPVKGAVTGDKLTGVASGPNGLVVVGTSAGMAAAWSLGL